jgi:hypothetical protein
MKYEYNPTLHSERLHTQTVIGAIEDYGPLYRLLHSGIFKFYISDNTVFYEKIEIPNDLITNYIIQPNKYSITIAVQIDFNNEYICLNELMPKYDNNGNVNHFLFEVLYEMKQHVKKVLYDLSPFKAEMDTIYNNLITNMHSVNFNVGHHEHFRTTIERMNETLNIELEEAIIGRTKKINNNSMLMDKEIQYLTLKGQKMPIEMDNAIEILDKIKETINNDCVEPKKTTEELESEEEAEYQRIDEMIRNGSNTLRLNRKTICNLPKSVSNKFVLPLEATNKDDVDKFTHLTKQPFSFLNYNDSMFSVNLNTGLIDMWDSDKDESVWNSLAQDSHSELKKIAQIIASKKYKIHERRKKLNKANNKLDAQVDYLKEQFELKADKFKHSSYVKFIATRTSNNIATIREAQNYSKRVEKALKNKRLIKSPTTFFHRALKLYLGKTGEDIISDLKTLKYTNKNDSELGIKYLLFLLKLIEKREDELIPPIITITDVAQMGVGFEQPEMVKVMAGHMFIHTVTITDVYGEQKSVTTQIQEFLDNGMLLEDIQEQYPELFV